MSGMDESTPVPRPEDLPPVTGAADLHARWRLVKGPWGFSVPQLFVLLFDEDGIQLPLVVNMNDNPAVPEDEMTENLFAVLSQVMGEHAPRGSVAMMWARPGRGTPRADDLAWIRALNAERPRTGIDTWPIHFGTDDGVRTVAPDELVA